MSAKRHIRLFQNDMDERIGKLSNREPAGAIPFSAGFWKSKLRGGRAQVCNGTSVRIGAATNGAKTVIRSHSYFGPRSNFRSKADVFARHYD